MTAGAFTAGSAIQVVGRGHDEQARDRIDVAIRTGFDCFPMTLEDPFALRRLGRKARRNVGEVRALGHQTTLPLSFADRRTD